MALSTSNRPVQIPASIEDVTVDWLTEATGLPITGMRTEQIGVGIGVSSAVYRVHLEGDGVPDTVVLKLPALDDAAVFTSTVLRLYIREVYFFDELAAPCPVRVPDCLHGAVDEETSAFVVVMEDLGAMRMVDQIVGMEIGDAERAVDELAAWHATWWGRAGELAERGVTVSLGDPIYPAILPTVFAEGWDKVNAELSVPDAISRVGERFADAMPGMLAALSQEPTTVLHGDYRADNMFFADDGSVALLDFQLIGTGRGAYDLAYFVTQSLDPEVASAHERPLFERWVEGLRQGGVEDLDTEDLWHDYRTAALFCLVYPIVASRGMDLDDPRQRQLIQCMNGRFARAVDELDLDELLQA